MGVAFYRTRFAYWQLQRDAPVPTWRQPRNCADARYLANLWAKRSYEARIKAKKHLERVAKFTLRDTPSWTRAVRQVQKVFPGTESWLLSCSDAEGWNRGDDTRWVIYGGRPYFPGAEYSFNGSLQQVGGPMQFMWSTFKGMYRNGLSHVRSRGYIVPDHLLDSGNVRAWRSMLGQAIAAGWARYTGNDNSHWSASWNNGC